MPIDTALAPELDDLAERLVEALTRLDFDLYRSFYAPDAVIWHNFDSKETDIGTNIGLLRYLFNGVIDEFSYEDIRRQPLPDGFVQQHTLRGKFPDGSMFALHACVIVTVRHGLIVRLDEYLDLQSLGQNAAFLVGESA